MFDIEASKNVRDLATSEKSTKNSEKLLLIQPLSESECSLNKLVLWWHALREWTHACTIYSTTQYYTTNTATTTS